MKTTKTCRGCGGQNNTNSKYCLKCFNKKMGMDNPKTVKAIQERMKNALGL